MTISSEAKLTDMRIDPEFAEQLRVPLRPIWQVVHRDVLVELLGTYAELGDLARRAVLDDEMAYASRVVQLGIDVRAGTLDHIDAALWRGGRGEAGE